MNVLPKAVISILVTLACADAETASRKWKSQINGNVYESSITSDELKASSKSETLQISPSVSGNFEPLGKCDLKQAIKLADLEADKII